jgi:hypothetical protein
MEQRKGQGSPQVRCPLWQEIMDEDWIRFRQSIRCRLSLSLLAAIARRTKAATPVRITIGTNTRQPLAAPPPTRTWPPASAVLQILHLSVDEPVDPLANMQIFKFTDDFPIQLTTSLDLKKSNSLSDLDI